MGFSPDSHSSGESQKHTGITRRRHNQLRTALVESAWQLIRRDAAMLDYYKHLTRRMKGQQAIIRVARRLLRRVRAVLVTGKMYMRGVEGAVTANDIAAPELPASKPKSRLFKKQIMATAGSTVQCDGFCSGIT